MLHYLLEIVLVERAHMTSGKQEALSMEPPMHLLMLLKQMMDVALPYV